MTVSDVFRLYGDQLLAGLEVTLRLTLFIWVGGLLVGGLLGIAAARSRRVVAPSVRGLSFLLSGIPVLVLLFWLHYPLQVLFAVVLPPFYTAAAALTVVNAVAVADLVRAALLDFPHQYTMAATVCGLSPRAVVLQIQLPLILRQLLPTLLILQVGMLQATLFASLISVDELFRVAQRINAEVYRPVEVYSALALILLGLCLPLNGVALYLRHKYTRDHSER